MKNFDWTGKMKPSEYKKMCDYCRKVGFNEIELEKELIDGYKYFVGLYDYTHKKDKTYIRIGAISQWSVDCKTKWIYVSATLQWINTLPTTLCDSIEFRKNISTTQEIVTFLENVGKLQGLSEELKLYQQ